MNSSLDITGYRYYEAEFGCAHAYLLPKVTELLDRYFAAAQQPRRLFDLGCGSGAGPAHFARLGYQVVGVEPNPEGVAIANASFAELTTRTVDPLVIAEGSSDDDLVARFGTFPAVISLEVMEHVFSPRAFAKKVFDLLEPGGMAIISDSVQWLPQKHSRRLGG